jgi:hypothetical protein
LGEGGGEMRTPPGVITQIFLMTTVSATGGMGLPVKMRVTIPDSRKSGAGTPLRGHWRD